MWIVVGLGNPGAEYAHTRHNIGFMVVETLARRWGVALRGAKDALRTGRGHVAGRPVILVEPQTFMNRSGESLAHLPLDADAAVIVVHDDLDLPAGQLRVRPRGGSGGHRGVASIVECCGGEVARVRVGIGRPPEGCDAADYVLAPVVGADLAALQAGVERAGDAVECLVTDGVDAAMSRFNARTAQEKE